MPAFQAIGDHRPNPVSKDPIVMGMKGSVEPAWIKDLQEKGVSGVVIAFHRFIAVW